MKDDQQHSGRDDQDDVDRPDEGQDDAQDEQDQDGGRDDDQDDAGDGDDQDDDDKPLGPKGQKALEREKARRRQEARKRREAEAELERLRNGDGDDADKARREGEQAATARANARIVRSEIKAAAAGKLADPKDAFKFLDVDAFEVSEDGEVDEEEIADAIADLLEKKPYLAAQSGTKPKFQGTGDGGARPKPPKTRPKGLGAAVARKLAK